MHRYALVLLLTAAGCKRDYEVTGFKRELSTEDATFDAGVVAVGDRQTLDIYLASTARGAVTVYDISVDDPDHWSISQGWKTVDEEEGDDADGYLTIEGTSTGDPNYAPVEVIFMPEAQEEYRTVLTIVSNDTEVKDRTDDNDGIWRVVLRGIGQYPCANVYPVFFDFGQRAAGGSFYLSGTIENCSNVRLTLADYDITGSSSFYFDTPVPIYVLPYSEETFEIAFQPAGGAPPEEAVFSLDMNDPTFSGTITAIGNDCEQSIDSSWDDDGDGWIFDGKGAYACGMDCNDRDSSVNPGAQERSGNEQDDDCDGETDEGSNTMSTDDDGDGYSENEGDCDDANAAVGPDATETLNHVDDDCDDRIDEGSEWYDDDGDGFSEREGDCDDDSVLLHPGAPETLDGVDQDCDGIVDEGTYEYDDDGDDFAELDDESDCNDDDPWTHPGATEDCDGRDNDCDGYVDEGEDGEAEGACAYVVERKGVPTTTDEPTCAATGRAVVPLLALIAALAGALRRRRAA